MNINLNFNPTPELLDSIFINFNRDDLERKGDIFLSISTEFDLYPGGWKYVVLEVDEEPLFVILLPDDQSYFDNDNPDMCYANPSSTDEVKVCNILSNMCDCFSAWDVLFKGSDYYHDMCRLLLARGGLVRLYDAVDFLWYRYIDANGDFLKRCESLLNESEEESW